MPRRSKTKLDSISSTSTNNNCDQMTNAETDCWSPPHNIHTSFIVAGEEKGGLIGRTSDSISADF